MNGIGCRFEVGEDSLGFLSEDVFVFPQNIPYGSTLSSVVEHPAPHWMVAGSNPSVKIYFVNKE